MSIIEKRRHLRLPVKVDYRLFVNNKEYSGRIDNISSSGAYLASIDPVLPASCVSQHGMLNLNLDEGGWVSAKCEIIYIGRPARAFFSQSAGVSLLW